MCGVRAIMGGRATWEPLKMCHVSKSGAVPGGNAAISVNIQNLKAHRGKGLHRNLIHFTYSSDSPREQVDNRG